VGSLTSSAPLVVRMDPRVPVTSATLRRQYQLASALAEDLKRDHDALSQVRAIRRQLAGLRANPAADSLKAAIDSADGLLAGFESGRRGTGGRDASLSGLNGDLAQVYGIIEGADAAPTSQVERAVIDLQVDLELTLKLTGAFTQAIVPALNRRLKTTGLPALSLGARVSVERRVGNGEGDDEP